MRKCFLWLPCILLVFAFTVSSSTANKSGNLLSGDSIANATPALANHLFSQYVLAIYQSAKLQDAGLDEAVFKKSITGYYNLKIANLLPASSSIITIVDLAKSSCTKRMWIVDLIKRELILNTWVAHGRKAELLNPRLPAVAPCASHCQQGKHHVIRIRRPVSMRPARALCRETLA